MGITESTRPHLVSPFAKKTNIHCSSPDSNIRWRTQHKELYRVHHTDDEDSENTTRRIGLEKSRKRRSNGALVSPLSVPMTRHDSPHPSMPTVDKFLTILNAPASPDSSYFSARSVSSSASSSQSTLNSILLDDVTEHLARTHIMEPCLSSESSISENSASSSSSTIDENSMTKKHDNENDDFITIIEQKPSPPPVPPKDHVHIQSKRLLTMDPQDNTITNMNNKQEKRSIMSRPADMRITTSDLPKSQFYASPNSDETESERPPIPPRRSSMPTPLPSSKQPLTTVPPMPVDAKQKANTYNSRRLARTLADER
jgi:hypothetical protein